MLRPTLIRVCLLAGALSACGPKGHKSSVPDRQDDASRGGGDLPERITIDKSLIKVPRAFHGASPHDALRSDITVEDGVTVVKAFALGKPMSESRLSRKAVSPLVDRQDGAYWAIADGSAELKFQNANAFIEERDEQGRLKRQTSLHTSPDGPSDLKRIEVAHGSDGEVANLTAYEALTYEKGMKDLAALEGILKRKWRMEFTRDGERRIVQGRYFTWRESREVGDRWVLEAEAAVDWQKLEIMRTSFEYSGKSKGQHVTRFGDAEALTRCGLATCWRELVDVLNGGTSADNGSGFGFQGEMKDLDGKAALVGERGFWMPGPHLFPEVFTAPDALVSEVTCAREGRKVSCDFRFGEDEGHVTRDFAVVTVDGDVAVPGEYWLPTRSRAHGALGGDEPAVEETLRYNRVGKPTAYRGMRKGRSRPFMWGAVEHDASGYNVTVQERGVDWDDKGAQPTRILVDY